MIRLFVAPTARLQLLEIKEFIAADNPGAAERYLDAFEAMIEQLHPSVSPMRADPQLPEAIRRVNIPGFAGYTAFVLFNPDQISVLAGFRPGLPDTAKRRAGDKGLGEV